MVTLIRFLGLFLPLAMVFPLWVWRQPDRRQQGALLLAGVWNIAPLLLLHLLAKHLGWWTFAAEGGLFLGVPIDLYLGWLLLWSVIPALAFPHLPLALVVAVMLSLDLMLMPAASPVIQLGPDWLWGEAVGLGGCLIPGQLLARWTDEDRCLAGRASLQVISFSTLVLWVLPTVILTLTGGSWLPFLTRPRWINALGLQVLAIPAILGLSAVQEFVQHGRGTPIPYDPPKRLVTSGVYVYIANPMQFSMLLLLIGWGILLESLWVSGAGLMALVYSAGLATWDEDKDLHRRYGDEWAAYRQAVQPWWLRVRPWHRSLPPTNLPLAPARLYVAAGCDPCSKLGRWLQVREPVGLVLTAAEDHPTRILTRLTYDPGDGSLEEVGVVALARGLEHLHLGWAFIGWVLRLPLMRQFAQLMIDAVGGEPREMKPRSRNVFLMTPLKKGKGKGKEKRI
jgi:protein-S-isoprenylcysteine O-methyltransferase Ste14